ncbi:oligosaccharide flippase family protein [Lutibacter sp. B1]|uniref:oligosaccharide flippase family protein n=1 Tax=Lutibacter sp. B1 TaxID=2725996 RepID=UPI00145793A7|nr:oligosaccharide flippase family protein [Lutibacter sp. B1]NLP58823.1 oligosaccharide flippase family protein [Lutibacter sp. B1]
MIQRFKSIFKKNKTLIHNFSYLSILQVFNLLLPLITYPYLIRVLGGDRYGLVIFTQSVIGYLVILVSFGFNISATKEISIYRDNKNKLDEIVSSTLLSKFLLFIISFLILGILLYILPQAKDYKTLFILTMWMCLYEAIFPMWYFQGLEKMKYITFITLISRLIFLGLIFVFIHHPSDYLYIPIINGIGAIIAGIISLIIVFKIDKINFIIPKLSTFKNNLEDSYPLFISRVSSIKDNTPIFLIGMFMGNQAVAYYDLSYKVIKIIISIFDNVTNVVFPKIANSKNHTMLKKIVKVEFLLLICSYLLITALSKYIILFLGGSSMLPAQPLFFITGVLLLRPLSSIIGSSVLIINGLTKEFMLNLIYSTIFYFFITIVLIPLGYINIYTLSSTIVLAQIFEFIHRIYIIKKNNLIHWVV